MRSLALLSASARHVESSRMGLVRPRAGHVSSRPVSSGTAGCRTLSHEPIRPTACRRESALRACSSASPSSCGVETLRWDAAGLVVAIVQDADTGLILMQAFADRAAIVETMETGLATFYSRSRKGRWCKGETSGHFIRVHSVLVDCDADSVIYVSSAQGPACHTGAKSCYYRLLGGGEEAGEQDVNASLPALVALNRTILARASEPAGEGKPSWTAKLLHDPELNCRKVREEADELCRTWEDAEGPERAASEAADLIYHALVLLRTQGVGLEAVCGQLRRRFGTSGIAEKASRPK